MSKYHKIDSVFLRDPENKRFLIEGSFARPEFEYLKDLQWTWTEKIDGKNIRIYWNGEDSIRFEGTRTAAGTFRPYRVGVAALYEALDLPVVPMALNSGVFWPRRKFIKRPGTITVEFLPPIPPGMNRMR